MGLWKVGMVKWSLKITKSASSASDRDETKAQLDTGHFSYEVLNKVLSMKIKYNSPWEKLLDQVLNHSKKKHRSIIIFSSEELHFPGKLSNVVKRARWNITARIFASPSVGGRYMSCSEMQALITEGQLYWQRWMHFAHFVQLHCQKRKQLWAGTVVQRKFHLWCCTFLTFLFLNLTHTHRMWRFSWDISLWSY